MEPLHDLVVIGISGRSGSGKDSAARALTFHRDCARIGLGDGVKGAFDDLSGITRECHKDLATAGVSVARAWQTLGTEARDAVPNGRNMWVYLASAKIAYLSRFHYLAVRRFVVPDVRFPHESAGLAEVVAAWGGRYGTLALSRPGQAPISGGRDPGHASEALVASVAAESSYLNDGTLRDLQAAAVAFFDELAAGRFDPRPVAIPAFDPALLDGEVG